MDLFFPGGWLEDSQIKEYWGQIKVFANINQICDLTPIITARGADGYGHTGR